MSLLQLTTFFTTGPFARANEDATNFSSKMYYSYLFSEYVQQHEKLLKEVEFAESENDDELLSEKQSQLQYFEGVFNLTLSINLLDELDS